MKTTLVLVRADETPMQQAIREMEHAHSVWMDTSVFTDAGKIAKAEMVRTRDAYLAQYRIENPTHIAC